MITGKDINKTIIHPELSYSIMQVAFAVHSKLGPGFTENIYEHAMICEFQARNIPYEQQKVITIRYNGITVGTYRLDLVVDGKIILELKAVEQISDLFRSQLRSYLKATGMQLGIILNFGNTSLQNNRVIYTRPNNEEITH